MTEAQVQKLKQNPAVQFRSEQIQRIVKQVSELTEIFTEMSRMVIEQGTVMDRIEENVAATQAKAIEGQLEVEKTVLRETSKKANACIVCLVQAILVCVALIAFQHSSW